MRADDKVSAARQHELADAAEAEGRSMTHVVCYTARDGEPRNEWCTSRPQAERRADELIRHDLGRDVSVVRSDRV